MNDKIFGKQLGPFTLKEKIGEGGMGEIRCATNIRTGKTVAIKLMHPQFAANKLLHHRFVQEGVIGAELQHPNVIDIIDYGEDPELGPYYVMEILQGETLANRLARASEKPLKSSEVCSILLQVVFAVEYLHANGIVHRDLKPENIFLITDGDVRVKLIDLGIAKLNAPAIFFALEGQTRVETAAGVLLGTPEYMSPEQVTGGVVDARTDLYALGIVLYEMLSGGASPFVQDSSSVAAILVAHVTTSPKRPSSLVGGWVKNHPLETLAMTLLFKEPEKRPAIDQIKATLFALRATSQSKTVVLEPASQPQQTTAPRTRRGTLPAVAVAFGVVVALLFWMRGEDNKMNGHWKWSDSVAESSLDVVLIPDDEKLSGKLTYSAPSKRCVYDLEGTIPTALLAEFVQSASTDSCAGALSGAKLQQLNANTLELKTIGAASSTYALVRADP